MRLSEIAEYIVEKYPDCCMAVNNDVNKGCREDWYEEYLIDPLMDFFSFELLDMCGCGCPEDTHELIRKFLTIRSEWQDKKISYEETMKPILKGARTMLFEDKFTTRIKDALADFTCDEFEVTE